MAEVLYLSDLNKERTHLQAKSTAAGLDEDELERLIALNQLDAELWCGLDTGAAQNRFLVAEDNWMDYVRDMVDGLSDIPTFLESFIDWEGVAASIRQDFRQVEFDGNTYFIRS